MQGQTIKGRPIATIMKKWAQTREASPYIITKDDATTTPFDLDDLKVVGKMSQRTLQTVARFCNKRMGIKFGQTITNFIKNKIARRTKMKYTKSEVTQEDGTTPAFYFRRAEDLCDIVAERTATLKNNDGFRVHEMRGKENKLPPLPEGQVDHYFSPVVRTCICMYMTHKPVYVPWYVHDTQTNSLLVLFSLTWVVKK